MKYIDDFLVNGEDVHWCGLLIRHNDKAVWVFKDRPHGYDVTFGLKGGAKGTNWNETVDS